MNQFGVGTRSTTSELLVREFSDVAERVPTMFMEALFFLKRIGPMNLVAAEVTRRIL